MRDDLPIVGSNRLQALEACFLLIALVEAR